MSETVLWPLEPHTGAKHAILKHYLDRWFPIVGRNRDQITYIDGFAGPGEYLGGEKGSPVVAVESALRHVVNGTLAPNVVIHFLFVESRKEHAAHLEKVLGGIATPPQFRIRIIQGEFCDSLGALLDRFEEEKKSLAPTFAFVDPFGFSGIPMSLMSRILRFERCEVFVNIMAEHINRFLEHPNDAVTRHFPETFGTNDVLKIPQHQGNRLDQILGLYRAQLRQHAAFVGRFDMHGRTDRKTYSLFFATNSSKGFEKMKESMWTVDKFTGSRFSDADPNPVSLFKSWGYEPLWDELHGHYAGQAVPMSGLEKFVIERTDFLPTHARKILAEYEQLGKITVEALPNFKRRGKTFPSDKVRIVFPAVGARPQVSDDHHDS